MVCEDIPTVHRAVSLSCYHRLLVCFSSFACLSFLFVCLFVLVSLSCLFVFFGRYIVPFCSSLSSLLDSSLQSLIVSMLVCFGFYIWFLCFRLRLQCCEFRYELSVWFGTFFLALSCTAHNPHPSSLILICSRVSTH